MKLGFTGTQHGMTEKQRLAVIKYFNYMQDIEEFHHGDCIGADAQAHDIAVEFHVPNIVVHPPVNTSKRAWSHRRQDIHYPNRCLTLLGPKEYLQRNRDIVWDTDVLLACPQTLNEELRSGTWSTIRYARKLGKTVWILEP